MYYLRWKKIYICRILYDVYCKQEPERALTIVGEEEQNSEA